MTDPKMKTDHKPRSGAYLPALPEGYGWYVEVRRVGGVSHADERIAAVISGGRDEFGPEKQVTFRTADGISRAREAKDLTEAAKIAANGVKALDKVHRERETLASTEADLLAGLGEPLTDRPD